MCEWIEIRCGVKNCNNRLTGTIKDEEVGFCMLDEVYIDEQGSCSNLEMKR